MDESKRQFILNRMKGLQKDVEAGRRVRTEHAAAQAAVRGGTAPVTFKAELVSGNSRVPVDINQVLQFIK